MPQERAEKRIDELPVLSEVTGTEELPISDDGIAKKVSVETLLDSVKAVQGLTEEIKTALLTIARKVAYIDEHGQTYYDALYNALYPPATLLSISAVFAQGSNVVYDTDTLESLKQYLTVTGEYDDGSSREVTNYTLSGTLVEGTSTITVTASGKTDTFSVTVTHRVWAVTSIDAVFNQGSATVYSNQSLDSLRQYLTVNATFENGDTSAVSDYTLSGTLTVGTSTITASYGGKTDTFTVTVTEAIATLVSISAVFTQGQNVVYDTDSLDTLKPYLVVTAHYDDNTDTVVSDYTLIGTLTVGTSTITVSYGGKTDTFTVVVSEKPRVLLASYDFTQGLSDLVGSNDATLTGAGAAQSSAGVTITAANSYLTIPNGWRQNGNFTIELDVSAMSKGFGAVHGRFLMFKADRGLIYRSSGYWQIYKGFGTNRAGGWVESTAVSDAAAFDGKTVVWRIQDGVDVTISQELYKASAWEVSCDGVTVASGEATSATGVDTTATVDLYVGQSVNGYFNVTVTGLRIYEGVE